MVDLVHLWESTVLPEQIDGLGHMNTRYYSVNSQRASGRLLRELGLESDCLESGPDVLGFPDVYIRYHKELLEGAPLTVRGGVLETSRTALRVYLELVNRETGGVAATFVETLEVQDRATRQPRDLSAEVRQRAAERQVEVPDYAWPRSLSLGPLRTDLPMVEAERRGMRVSREPLLLDAAWCDGNGFLRIDDSNTLFMVVHGIQRRGDRALRDNNFRTADGRLLGWAMMESRQVLTRLPKEGERLSSYQAETRIEDKVHSTTRWIYNADSGALCAVMQSVALAFDIEARRPISIPEPNRRELMAHYHPDLG